MNKETYCPLVSVIMSCYNEKIEWVETSINSILNQSYDNIEFIIICDNPKYNELIELLDKYKYKDNRIVLSINIQNLGLVKSLNKALKLCTGSYIARMDADDISNKNRIKKQVEYMVENQLDFVTSGAEIINENDKSIGFSKMFTDKDNLRNVLKYRNICIHPSWMFTRRVLDTLEEYDEVTYVEDYDFLCRAILNGFDIKCIPENLIKYRVRENSVCRSNRVIQELIKQKVSSNYKEALARKKVYDAKNIVLEITKDDVEKFRKEQEKFIMSKQLLKSGKYLRGIFFIIISILISKTKRRQLKDELIVRLNGWN